MTRSNFRQSGTAIAVSIALSALTSTTFAQTSHWTGGAYHSVTDDEGNVYWVDDGSDWATGANWSNGAPGAGDVVNIDRQSASTQIGVGHSVVEVTDTQAANILNVGTDSINGLGQLNIQSGGTLNVGTTVSLGTVQGATGQINITSGATLESSGDLIVGESGSGALTLTNGATVQSGYTVIGDHDEASGSILVDSGSTLNSDKSLIVGSSGKASLTLKNDGRVSIGNNGTVYVAEESIATGTLNVGAAGSNASNATSAGHLDAARVVFGKGAGTLNFNHTDSDYQFNAALEGDGRVNHIAGETVLNGDSGAFLGQVNVAGGDLVVNNRLAAQIDVGPSGALRVGSGGTTGEVLSDMANDGQVIFDRSNEYQYAKVISGTGSVEQAGTGTTILTGENTYTGGTLVDDGTLQLGAGANGGTSGSLVGDIAISAPGTFAFNRSDPYTFAGVLSGEGRVDQRGAGRTELTGDSSVFAGNTQVNAGILAVNGQLGGSTDVFNGATLAGNGQVGSTTLHNGGRIAPGNSIGTLTVAGDLNQRSGSIYQVELESTGARDHLAVTGMAQLDAGSVIDATKLDANPYELDRRYIVLSADQGVSGRYTLTGNTPVSSFYKLVDNYDAHNVYLDVQQTRSFQEAAATANQRATATGAQSLKGDAAPAVIPPTHNKLFKALANLPTDEQARNAFDQLSGEFHASLHSALIEDSRLIRDAANQRLHSAFGAADNGDKFDAKAHSGITPWLTALGNWGDIKGDGNAAKLHHETTGFVTGVDAPVGENARIGALAGYSNTDLKNNSRNSSSKNDNIHLGFYGGTQFGQLNLRAGTAYTWSRIDAKRSVNFEGYSDQLKSTYDAGTWQAFGELGQRFELNPALHLEPFANLTSVHVKTDAFKENGAEAALQAKRGSDQQTATTLGLRATSDFKLDSGKSLTLFGTAGWKHAFDRETPSTTLRFDGSDAFRVEGVALARDSAVLGVGVESEVSKGLNLGASYSGQLGDGAREHGLQLSASYRF